MSLGWGSVLAKVFTFIPGRVERLKNERQRLLDEKQRLLREIANVENARRMQRITDRLHILDGLLANKSQD